MKILLAALLISVFNTSAIAEDKVYAAITLEKAIEAATRDVPGRVLEAEFEKGVYEVKILTDDGEKIKVKIDPKDGGILRKGRVIKTANVSGR